ncbi:YraN family protein [Nocardia jejuensis]|uniref:YraN family protein n=1 Tax=Nocardia jejuensis TaxID=328049 RepID=UPI00082BFF1A|nr:YraN family protein [Nocardia jejuensis]
MGDNLALGAQGEELAARFLSAAGLEIVARNWRCRYGELDIIARDAGVTVFIEVKTRSGLGFGTPAEAVTYLKQQRIRRLALLWLDEQRGPWLRIRFDVVSVLLRRCGGDPVIQHLEAVF